MPPEFVATGLVITVKFCYFVAHFGHNSPSSLPEQQTSADHDVVPGALLTQGDAERVMNCNHSNIKFISALISAKYGKSK
jgi:hypothetical protein